MVFLFAWPRITKPECVHTGLLLWRLHQQHHFAHPCPLNTWEGKARRTAEQGEKNNDLALLPSPRRGREGFPSPPTPSIEHHAAQNEAGALGAGGERPAQQAVPAAQGKTHTGSRGLRRGAGENGRKAPPWGHGPGPGGGRTGGRDDDADTLARAACVSHCPSCLRDAVSVIPPPARLPWRGVTPSTDEETEAQEGQTGEARRGGWI